MLDVHFLLNDLRPGLSGELGITFRRLSTAQAKGRTQRRYQAEGRQQSPVGRAVGVHRHCVLQLESPYERPSRVRRFFRRRSSRAERNQRLVLVGLLTLELKCQAFSSVQTANLW